MRFIFFPIKFVVWLALWVVQFIMFLTVLPFAFGLGIKKAGQDIVRWSTRKDDCIRECVQELSDIFLLGVTDHFFNSVKIWTWKGIIDYEEYTDENGFLALRRVEEKNN